jgi:hypothetical protein
MKKLPFKKIGYGLIIVFVIMQFIQPSGNNGEASGENDITHMATISPDLMSILQTSCYDCHSNHTNYPWYSKIQPIGFWLDEHVNDGKKHLNFSEYNSYTLKRKKHKLEEIAEQVKEHEMPMWQYSLIHTNAKLNEDQITLLVNWANTNVEKIILPDSLTNNK